MPYEMNMEEETPPKRLLSEGWKKFTIKSCVEETSSGGNKMFVMKWLEHKTRYVDTIYAIAEPKKRWLLKQILASCNVRAAQDGVYNWEISDIEGKEIAGLVEHSPNEYINRKGETVKTIQHNIVDVKTVDEAIAWDEND